MNHVARHHRQALEATRTTVAGVKADQWAAPTPNEGWDVRALVNHIVSGNLWVVELVAGRARCPTGLCLDPCMQGTV